MKIIIIQDKKNKQKIDEKIIMNAKKIIEYDYIMDMKQITYEPESVANFIAQDIIKIITKDPAYYIYIAPNVPEVIRAYIYNKFYIKMFLFTIETENKEIRII